jgi:4-hydroxy-2-oxoheptanedioate aldolase
MPNAFGAEVLARQGWDSVTVDLQHGLIDFQMAVSCIQAIDATPAVALVRPPWNDAAIIMKLLDAGARGVICPLVNSAAEAKALVDACRYPPAGRRSFGPVRAAQVYGADYWQRADDAILVFAMIETREAMAALDDILAVPGLDGVYIGPSDLGLSLVGKPDPEPTDATVIAAVAHIRERAVAHGKIPCCHNMTPEHAAKMAKQGFRLVTVGNDTRFLALGAAAAVRTFRTA